MTEQSIIELSSYNCISKNTSSDFVSKLSKPITLNEGDVIQVRNSFLDTRLLSNQFINFDTDQNIIISFYYYTIFTGMSQVTQTENGSTITSETIDEADCLPYVVKDWDNNPIYSSISFTIPAGVYSCDNLATLISRNLQQVNEIPNLNIRDSAMGIPIGNNKLLETPLLNTILTFEGNHDYSYQAMANPLDVSNIQCVPLVQNASLIAMGSTGYRRAQVCGYYPGSGFNDINGGLIGAKEFSVQFNNENSGKFEFTYMHSPIVSGTNGDEVICIRQCVPTTEPDQGFVHFNFFCSLGGIIFRGLEPVSFWQQLGFDVNSITFNADSINEGLTYQQFLNSTTRNYMAYQQIFANTAFTIKDNDDKNETSIVLMADQKFDKPYNTWFTSDKTYPLLAVDPPISSSSSGGHYLLEIKEYDSEYINNDKEYRIKGIIPTYYLSQDSFATSYEDTLSYVHKGEPLQLTSLSIRILNPITKSAAELGDNNTIYLQVTQNVQ